jgi:hypothetical protein
MDRLFFQAGRRASILISSKPPGAPKKNGVPFEGDAVLVELLITDT